MADDEVKKYAQVLLGNDKRYDDSLDVYISLAKDAMVTHLYPFEESATYDDVPARLNGRTAEIACYLANKQGAEGEASHSENGVSRTYGDAYIPSSYFRGIVPFCGNVK